MRISHLAFPLAFCASVTAQATDDRVVVITRTPAPALTTLLDVDLRTGASYTLNRFSLDTFAPLAVAVDGVNRDVIVALQSPANASVLVRLRVAGSSIVQQQALGDVPGAVTALAQARGGQWIATTDAGVFTTERNGGVARLLAALPRASAVETFGLGSHQAVLAQSGSATADPAVRWLDLDSGQTIAGPWVYPGHTPRGFTGVGDLPTGQSRQVVGQDDGTVAVSVNFANPVPLSLAPALPAGATVAVRVRGLEGVALGNSAHPVLKSFVALNGTQPISANDAGSLAPLGGALRVLNATLRVPIEPDANGWTYKGSSFKIGAPLSFETPQYIMNGQVADAALPQRIRPARGTK